MLIVMSTSESLAVARNRHWFNISGQWITGRKTKFSPLKSETGLLSLSQAMYQGVFAFHRNTVMDAEGHRFRAIKSIPSRERQEVNASGIYHQSNIYIPMVEYAFVQNKQRRV